VPVADCGIAEVGAGVEGVELDKGVEEVEVFGETVGVEAVVFDVVA
jgi:hypothetical protein